MAKLQEYVDLLGRNYFDRWFKSLDASVQRRIVLGLDRLERGNDSSVKSVGAGVFEMRFVFGPGYRVYFGREGAELILLLGGGSKQRQSDDIFAAKQRWQEYKMQKEDSGESDQEPG